MHVVSVQQHTLTTHAHNYHHHLPPLHPLCTQQSTGRGGCEGGRVCTCCHFQAGVAEQGRQGSSVGEGEAAVLHLISFPVFIWRCTLIILNTNPAGCVCAQVGCWLLAAERAVSSCWLFVSVCRKTKSTLLCPSLIIPLLCFHTSPPTSRPFCPFPCPFDTIIMLVLAFV